MGRWTQFDEDSHRLPEGFKRIGYDSDEQLYYYYDGEGSTWVSKERYGVMYPAKRPKNRAEAKKNPLYADDNDLDIEDDEEYSDNSGEDQATLFSDDGTLVPESSCNHGRKPSLTIPKHTTNAPFGFLAAGSISPAEPPPKGNQAFRNIARLIGGASAFKTAGKAIATKAHEIAAENAKLDDSDAPTISEKLLHSTPKEKVPVSPITGREKHYREASYPKEKDYYHVEHSSPHHHNSSATTAPTKDLRRAVSMKEDKSLPPAPGKHQSNASVQRSATQVHHSRAATTTSAKDSDHRDDHHHHHHHTSSRSIDRKADKPATHQSDVSKPAPPAIATNSSHLLNPTDSAAERKNSIGAGKESPSKLLRRERERARNTASPVPVSPTTPQEPTHKREESAASNAAKPRKLEKRNRGSLDTKLEISAPIPIVLPKDSGIERERSASQKEISEKEKKDSSVKRTTMEPSLPTREKEKKQVAANGGSLFIEGL